LNENKGKQQERNKSLNIVLKICKTSV